MEEKFPIFFMAKKIVTEDSELSRRLAILEAKFEAHAGMEQDLMKEMVEGFERMNRVIFGDADTVGMQTMMKELHTKFIQANGLLSFLKLLLLIGGVSGMLYAFFRRF